MPRGRCAGWSTRFAGAAPCPILNASPSAGRPRLPPRRPPPAPSSQPAPAPAWDTAVVRELAMTAFNDEELTTFCYDNFRPVYEEFTTGMSRTQKVQRLVETCDRRGEMAKLLARVERANPYQYNRFKDHLGN